VNVRVGPPVESGVTGDAARPNRKETTMNRTVLLSLLGMLALPAASFAATSDAPAKAPAAVKVKKAKSAKKVSAPVSKAGSPSSQAEKPVAK
jgi:hypothetical protein